MKKHRKQLIILILIVITLTTGCTKVLTDSEKKAVKNPATGQTLTKNILCQPENKKTIEIYNNIRKI